MPERNNEYVYQPPAKFTEELRQRINNAGFSDEFKQQIKSAQKEEGRKMFERLTHRSKYGIAYTKIAVNESNMVDVGECYTGRIIDRLAAYEDSGLSPEEVQKLKKSDASKEQCTIDQHGEIHRLRDELKRYKQAEQEGRLMVLPCKVGTPVFEIKFNQHDGYWIEPAEFKLSMLSAFGKTVFLSRKEAEKALGGGR
mgnify:CR=1 FL=1